MYAIKKSLSLKMQQQILKVKIFSKLPNYYNLAFKYIVYKASVDKTKRKINAHSSCAWRCIYEDVCLKHLKSRPIQAQLWQGTEVIENVLNQIVTHVVCFLTSAWKRSTNFAGNCFLFKFSIKILQQKLQKKKNPSYMSARVC